MQIMQFYIFLFLLLLQLACLNQFTFAVKRLSIHYFDKENQGPSKAKYNVKPHITTHATTPDPPSAKSHTSSKEIETTSYDLKEETSLPPPVQDSTTEVSSDKVDSDSTSEANEPTSEAKELDSETKETESETKEPESETKESSSEAKEHDSSSEVNANDPNDRDTDLPGHLGSLCTDRGDCNASKFLDCSRELEGQSMPKDGRLNQTIIDANMKHQHSGTCVCMMGLRNFEGIECNIEYNEPCETGMIEKLTTMGYKVASSPKCYQADCTPINNGHFCRSHHEAGAMFISQEKLDEL